MLEKLKHLDTELFLFINGKHNAFFDTVMYWASHKFFWIPFYIFLIWIIYTTFKRKTFAVLFSITLLITLCDQTASKVLKPLVKRLRPSHEPSLQELVHLSEAGPGGQYGFVSSHAANVFGLAVFLMLLLPKKYRPLKVLLLCWAILVSYSRIYNGVHYAGDIIVATMIGILYAFLVKKLLDYYFTRKEQAN